MPWYLYIAQFLGGVFLANALPHLVTGITGQRMPTPFASPPFKGLSAPTVNVAWALVNLALAYLLLHSIGRFEIGRWADAAVGLAGFGGWAFQCARALGHLQRPAP